ncbi:MAG: hypothetical protein ACREMN_01265 [Gemmatimonadales bacterium]
MALAVGEYVAIDPAADSGCAIFPANGAPGEAEYLLVPQLATSTAGGTTSFQLVGDTLRLTATPAPAPPARRPAPSPAARFHAFLRRGEERRSWGFAPQRGPALLGPVAPAPPAYGSTRQFAVCSDLECSSFADVTATVRAVQTKVAIYVDDDAPPGGLDSTALDGLARLFDDRLYPADTAAFGRESDIDDNTVVLILMTPVVNKLITEEQCQESGFVAGFFLGADIDPDFQSDPRSNKGEVFYSVVADPQGTVSCAHSTTQVERLVPVTFIHEFQHMISYNQHVLVRGGDGEQLWLNEGLAHFAEELGGRTYAPGTAEFSRFLLGDLFNAYQYLDSTSGHFLLPTEGIGSLAERGASWLFVRYLVDRYSGDTTVASWNAFTRQLVETSQVGAANISAVTGDVFVTIVTRWALANWVSDLPGFVAPPELRYDSWSFRVTYASLNAQDRGNFPKPFPLVPTVSTGRATNVTGTLHAGSGVYHRATQPGSDPAFITRLRTSNGGLLDGSLSPRLNVIRIR